MGKFNEDAEHISEATACWVSCPVKYIRSGTKSCSSTWSLQNEPVAFPTLTQLSFCCYCSCVTFHPEDMFILTEWRHKYSISDSRIRRSLLLLVAMVNWSIEAPLTLALNGPELLKHYIILYIILYYPLFRIDKIHKYNTKQPVMKQFCCSSGQKQNLITQNVP